MKKVFLLLFRDEFKEYFSLTARQKFYVWYFCLSLCFLCITDDSPVWAIIVVVLNFANATRLIKKCQFQSMTKKFKQVNSGRSFEVVRLRLRGQSLKRYGVFQ